MSSTPPQQNALRPPAEQVYARELAALHANDSSPHPAGRHLSPQAVHTFIVGSTEPLCNEWQGEQVETPNAAVVQPERTPLWSGGNPGSNPGSGPIIHFIIHLLHHAAPCSSARFILS